MDDRASVSGPGAGRRVINAARWVLAAVALAAVLAAPAGASTRPGKPAARAIAGSLGVKLLTVPVATSQDPLARLYIIDHLHPGTTIHRLIEVSNTTASTMRISLYPAAATIGHGSFIGAVGHTPDALSTWTSVSPGVSHIRAGGRLTARVTIDVPPDAPPGEQYGVVWAETRSAPPLGSGITEVSRAGIRMYLSVGPGGAPAAKFTITSLTSGRARDGQPMVIATVHNTGGRALDMSGTLQLTSGPGGLRAGPFRANLGVSLAIGDTEPVTIALDKRLPAGPWDALVTLHSGLTTGSARATITFPTAAGSTPPYIAIVILAIALLAIVTVLRAIRRRHNSIPRPRLQSSLPRTH
jgi:hypothetical protein